MMEQMLQYAKFFAAIAGAALTTALQAMPMDGVTKGWVTIALAAMTAVAVYAVPNRQAQ